MKEVLQGIADNINALMPDFDNSYVCVERDNEGVAISHSGENVLFPADHLGNYFYLRPSGNIEYIKNNRKKINVVLLVYYKDGDRDNLLANFEQILTQKCMGINAAITPIDALIDNIEVVRNEVGKAHIRKAINNLPDNVVLLLINFSITISSNISDCILNNCKTCI